MSFIEEFKEMNKNFPYIKKREDILNDVNFTIDIFRPEFNKEYKKMLIDNNSIKFVICACCGGCHICKCNIIHIDYENEYWGDDEFNKLLEKYNYSYEWINNNCFHIIED